MNGTSARQEKFLYLEGLRAIAILLVIIVHVSQAFPELPHRILQFFDFGKRGVQLFFVVSGYTLTKVYFGRGMDVAQFFTRRFFRIAPIFYLAGAVYIALGALGEFHYAARPNAFQVITTLLFIHGWFPSSINYVVPGGWSIGAEAMFYVLFPLLFAMMRNRRAFFALAALSYPLAMVVRLVLDRWGPEEGTDAAVFASYFFLVHLPAFASGCAVALIEPVLQKRLAVNWRAFFWVLLLAVPAMALTKATSNALLADLVFASLVLASALARPAFIESPLFTWIGRISFSVYLVHFLFLNALFLLQPRLVAAVGVPAGLVVGFAGVTVGSLLLSDVTHRFIEKPMIALGRRVDGMRERRKHGQGGTVRG